MGLDVDDVAHWVGGGRLDRVAEAVFATGDGPRRLAPLLERWDREVGPVRRDDVDFAALQVLRTDWALCDAAIGAPGETWAWRVARGALLTDADDGGIPLAEDALAASSTTVGLFELWPGAEAWIRDRLGGVCMRLLDPTGPVDGQRDRPAALWEVRVAFDPRGDGARLCRPPIEYPLELVELLEQVHGRRFDRPAWPDLQLLRRARLHWTRARGKLPFARALGQVDR